MLHDGLGVINVRFAGYRRCWADLGRERRMCVAMVALLVVATSSASSSFYPPDRSLTTVEYVRRGLPATDRAWAPTDYAVAVEVLRKLSAEDPSLLPRFGSPKSGEVFARLVSEDNLGVLATETPIQGRLGIASDFLGSGKQLTLLYLEPSTSNLIFDSELAEVSGFLLRVWVQLSVLLNELNAGQEDSDLVAARMARSGSIIAMYLSSVLDSIADADSFRTPARARLVAHLGQTLPRLTEVLSPIQKADFRAHADRVVASEADPATQSALRDISALVAEE